MQRYGAKIMVIDKDSPTLTMSLPPGVLVHMESLPGVSSALVTYCLLNVLSKMYKITATGVWLAAAATLALAASEASRPRGVGPECMFLTLCPIYLDSLHGSMS